LTKEQREKMQAEEEQAMRAQAQARKAKEEREKMQAEEEQAMRAQATKPR
jgi:hypothetical protein